MLTSNSTEAPATEIFEGEEVFEEGTEEETEEETEEDTDDETEDAKNYHEIELPQTAL